MVDQGICPHTLRNGASWHCHFLYFPGRISWDVTQRVDETGYEYFRGGYWVVYGWGHRRISVLEAATNFFWVFNNSATMARQGDRVQQAQTNMCLALILPNGQKWVFALRNRGNTTPDQEIPHQSLRKKEAGSWVSWASKSEGFNRKTHGNGSGKSDWRLPSLPQ